MSVTLGTLSLGQLVELYNLIAENSIKRFRDKPTAEARLSMLLEDKNMEVFEVDGEYDVRDIAPEVESVEQKLAAAHATTNDLIARAVAADPELAEYVKAPGKRGPVPEFTDNLVITVLVNNPKRPNSASYARFALYHNGQTVGEFIAAGGRRVDLKWDTNHEYIKVLPAK